MTTLTFSWVVQSGSSVHKTLNTNLRIDSTEIRVSIRGIKGVARVDNIDAYSMRIEVGTLHSFALIEPLIESYLNDYNRNTGLVE